MDFARHVGIWKRALNRGVFPHQFWWVLELRWRRIVLSPQTLVSRVVVRPDASVLEIGAGSGYYTTEVASLVRRGQVTVFDIQVEMLERCRQKCRSVALANVAYVVGDAAALPFADAAFDMVYMVTVFGEVADQDACLSGVRRILGPGGILSISEHLPDPDFTSLSALRQRAERAGFALESTHGSRWAYTANFRIADPQCPPPGCEMPQPVVDKPVGRPKIYAA